MKALGYSKEANQALQMDYFCTHLTVQGVVSLQNFPT